MRDRHPHLGNYEPLLQLATGGMATVYVARQIGAAGFERLVVVKRVHPHLLSNREFYDMFRDEARVAAMLHHPNVVPVTDVVEADGELFLVMEYVDSVALSTLMKAAADMGQRLPAAAAVRVMVDTLGGLHAAHEALDMRGQRLEIVHRDVSPQNVIVGVDGTTRLIDFGVAKARHRLTETRSGSLKGKYGYMSPEQAKAQPVDRRADLFSAGIVLWESLTGHRLFRGETEFDTIRRIAEGPIVAPSTMVPGLSRELDAVVLKSLERDREQRFQSAPEFIDALEGAFFPAPARDVASIVRAYCGERIEGRRTTLQGMLDGQIEPLSMGRIAIPSEEPTSPSSPTSRRRLIEGHEGTESQIAATHDAFPSLRPSRKAWVLGAAAGFVAVAAVAIAVATLEHRSTPSTSAAAGSIASSASTQPSGVSADEVALRLTADGPIDRVSAPGIHGAEVDGAHARLVVARWGGDLPLEAVLAGGATARAVAASDGSRDIHLATVARPPPVASSAAIALPPPAASEPKSAPKPAHPPPAGRPPGELHANPYGP
ncbi:MAG TPA: serine/threonine-protein kinase [Polyangiaceae bacterium]|jgi:serine/threonine-protein kinase